MSKVISPIDLTFYVSPDFVGQTRVQLIGEDGRELYTKSFRTFKLPDSATRVQQKIDFEIRGAAEVARLQISTVDKYGRMQAFNSLRLLLLSVGESQLNPPLLPVERVLLRVPKKGTEIRGGALNIEGEIQPVNNEPVILELYDTVGNLLGSRLLIIAASGQAYQPFTTIIPYKVDKTVPARLVIRQDDDRIAGLAYLFSIELQISP